MSTREEQRMAVKRREEVKKEALETLELLGKCSDADVQRILDLLCRHTVDRVAGIDMNALQYHANAMQKMVEVLDFLRSVRIVDEAEMEERRKLKVSEKKRVESPLGKSPKTMSPTATTPTKKYIPPGNPNRTTPTRNVSRL
ncbi:hypothetical protein QR680_016746 [Steinernema hermaphroditum]|uniref:Uncharacterized protein n=1 Tax=Steinernema hermaphroditum TaxID=289476 RepID=A0AA39HC59_9BILA|nr:hypothetical protein QR680_016746 [Steinernema hermaphroditum]